MQFHCITIIHKFIAIWLPWKHERSQYTAARVILNTAKVYNYYKCEWWMQLFWMCTLNHVHCKRPRWLLKVQSFSNQRRFYVYIQRQINTRYLIFKCNCRNWMEAYIILKWLRTLRDQRDATSNSSVLQSLDSDYRKSMLVTTISSVNTVLLF